MHLKPKLVLVFLPVIVVQILVLLIPLFLTYQDYINQQVRGQIKDSTERVQTAINNQLSAIEADSSIFAQSLILARYLRTEDKTIRFNLMHQVLLKEFSTFMRAHPEYIEISIITPDGYEEVSLLNDGIINQTGEEQDTSYFKKIEASTANFEIYNMLNPDTNQWVLVSARKIFQKSLSEQSGSTKATLKGYLIVKTSFNFIDYLLKYNSLIDNGFVILHDANGTPITQKLSDNFSNDKQFKVLTENGHYKQLKISTWLLNNESYIVGQKRLTDTLFYCIGWPESELDKLFVSMGYTSLQNSLIVICFSGLIFFLILNKLLVRPILQLSLSAKKMGQGDNRWSFQSDADDELTELAHTIKDMGQGLLQQKQKVHEIAYRDSLTQLPNRRQFIDELEHQYYGQNAALPDIALLFLDLDGFKQVNDTCGHVTGDQVLIAVAERLKRVLHADDSLDCAANSLERANNSLKCAANGFDCEANSVDCTANSTNLIQHEIARLGGDEFTILLKGVKHRNIAGRIAVRILNSFSNPFVIAGREFLIGVSIGISLAAENGQNAEDLLKNADTAMYDAKMQGKNTYRFFSKITALKSLKALQIKDDLRRAINNNQLKIVYQPQICTNTGKIIGCEALVRWNQPGIGWVSPDIFIPIAEESGLIMPLGKWVLFEACQQVKQWQLMGYPVVRVSVNVSCVQLARVNMYQVIQDCLQKTGLSASLLTVEVTETSILQGSGSIMQLEKLQSAGIRIALDDFGTGYSSLSALRGLPIDELKIDKSFITDLNSGKDGEAIVSAIIAMAHQLGLQIVAEGVERLSELNFLEQSNADTIQGYYFSKPLQPEQFIDFLSANLNFQASSEVM